MGIRFFKHCDAKLKHLLFLFPFYIIDDPLLNQQLKKCSVPWPIQEISNKLNTLSFQRIPKLGSGMSHETWKKQWVVLRAPHVARYRSMFSRGSAASRSDFPKRAIGIKKLIATYVVFVIFSNVDNLDVLPMST